MIVTQDPVNNNILSLHVGRGMVSSVKIMLGQNGKLGHSCTKGTKGKLYDSRVSDHATVYLGLNVSSYAHNCGCVVEGGGAVAAISVLLLLLLLIVVQLVIYFTIDHCNITSR